MTDLREAAQMALDALEQVQEADTAGATPKMVMEARKLYEPTITALRAALANEFNPDWDAMAVMVEEQQRLAKRIEELEAALAADKPSADRLAQPEQKAQFEFQNYGWWRDEQGKLQLGTLPQRECVGTAHDRREWQGLTDEEIEDVCWTEVDQRLRSFARAIEAKLKEKNGL